MFPLKNNIIIYTIMLSSFVSFSQKIQNNDYKLYLSNLIENETSFENKMNLSNKSQFYYEGKIKVMSRKNGNIKIYNFFFSTWDDKYKEFIVKDEINNVITPKIFFKSKEIAYTIKKEKTKLTKLQDNSIIDNVILSSMLVWLSENN